MRGPSLTCWGLALSLVTARAEDPRVLELLCTGYKVPLTDTPSPGHELCPPCSPSVLPDRRLRSTVLGRGGTCKRLMQPEQTEEGQVLGLDA